MKEREEAFLSDPNSSEYVKRQFLDFKDILEKKKDFLSTKNFHLSSHFYPVSPFLVFRSYNNSVILFWKRPNPDNIVRNVLSIELWHGLLSLRTVDPRTDFDSGVNTPKALASYRYTYTINDDGISGWKSLDNNEFHDNERIINSTIEWLLEMG